MKTLLGLSIVQSVVIAILAFFVFDERNSPAPRTTSSNAIPANHRSNEEPETALARPVLHEERLRRIVREELAAAMPAAPTLSVVAKPPPDPIAAANQRERIERVLANYQRRGSITSREMQELQQDIAHLNDDDRAQMASSLVRALNAGVVKLENE